MIVKSFENKGINITLGSTNKRFILKPNQFKLSLACYFFSFTYEDMLEASSNKNLIKASKKKTIKKEITTSADMKIVEKATFIETLRFSIAKHEIEIVKIEKEIDHIEKSIKVRQLMGLLKEKSISLPIRKEESISVAKPMFPIDNKVKVQIDVSAIAGDSKVKETTDVLPTSVKKDSKTTDEIQNSKAKLQAPKLGFLFKLKLSLKSLCILILNQCILFLKIVINKLENVLKKIQS